MIIVNKAQYMHILTKRNIFSFNYDAGGTTLTKVGRYKYLGIISSDLKGNIHVE